jgi:multidrug efflux system membrane fusion protein
VLTTLVSVSPIYASFDADEQIVARAIEGWTAARAPRAGVRASSHSGADGHRHGGSTLHRPSAAHRQPGRCASGTVRVRAVFDNADGS